MELTGSKKIACSIKKMLIFFKPNFVVSAFIDIITMSDKFQRNLWSRSPEIHLAYLLKQ